MEIITIYHKRFWEFIEQLEPHAMNCHNNLDGAVKVLNQMGSVDVSKSIQYLEANGGYCDCEIMFNIAVGGGRARPPKIVWVMN